MTIITIYIYNNSAAGPVYVFHLVAECCDDIKVLKDGNELLFEKVYQEQRNNHPYYTTRMGDWIIQYCNTENGAIWEILEKAKAK